MTAALQKIGDVRSILASGLPPKLTIDGPTEITLDDTREFELRVQLTERSGGIGKIVYRVNNVARTPAQSRLPDVLRPKGKGQRILRQPITLAPGRNEIRTTVRNRAGNIESRAATVVVHVNEPVV